MFPNTEPNRFDSSFTRLIQCFFHKLTAQVLIPVFRKQVDSLKLHRIVKELIGLCRTPIQLHIANRSAIKFQKIGPTVGITELGAQNR